MKLSHWAKKQGIQYLAAWKMFNAGLLKNAYRLPTGTIVIQEEEIKTKDDFVVTYARVSSTENKSNLENQSKRLIDFCNATGWKTHLNLTEIGSGLNDRRPKLLKVLSEGQATKLVVEHKDRLTRFGASYIELCCKHFGCEVIYINNVANEKEDLVQDFVSVITSFCARLYGHRRTKRKTEELIKSLETND